MGVSGLGKVGGFRVQGSFAGLGTVCHCPLTLEP